MKWYHWLITGLSIFLICLILLSAWYIYSQFKKKLQSDYISKVNDLTKNTDLIISQKNIELQKLENELKKYTLNDLNKKSTKELQDIIIVLQNERNKLFVDNKDSVKIIFNLNEQLKISNKKLTDAYNNYNLHSISILGTIGLDKLLIVDAVAYLKYTHYFLVGKIRPFVSGLIGVKYYQSIGGSIGLELGITF